MSVYLQVRLETIAPSGQPVRVADWAVGVDRQVERAACDQVVARVRAMNVEDVLVWVVRSAEPAVPLYTRLFYARSLVETAVPPEMADVAWDGRCHSAEFPIGTFLEGLQHTKPAAKRARTRHSCECCSRDSAGELLCEDCDLGNCRACLIKYGALGSPCLA